jgi:hypothetical protein
MSTPTSSPWIYYKSGHDCFIIRNAGLHGNGHLRTFTADETDEANARLACAAPELLVALKKAMMYVDHDAPDDVAQELWGVINQAEGKS